MRRVMLLLLFTAGVICSSVLLRAQGPSSEVQILNKTYDSTNNALRINAVATGGGAGSPNFYNADQLYNLIFDNTNTALRVNCVVGCGGGGAGSPGGASGSVQFNNAGAFGGAANATYNSVSGVSTLALADKAGQVFNVKAYGAKGDGVFLYTGSITTGTANLTVTGASFTSADVGKSIEVDGAGASGNPLVSTISSVTDATHMVLADNASTTKASGAFVIYGTSDQSVINSTITTAFSAGGGTVFFPAGVYIAPGPIDVNHFFITLPMYTGNFKSIALVGAAPTNATGNGPGAPSIIYGFYSTTANAQLIAAPFNTLTGNYLNFNDYQATLKNLEVVTCPVNNPYGINFTYARNALLENVDVHQNITGGTISQPGGSGFGIQGTNTNGSLNRYVNVHVAGYNTCLRVSEHAQVDTVGLLSCNIGLQQNGSAVFHAMHVSNLDIEGTGTNVAFTGIPIYGEIDVQDDGTNTFDFSGTVANGFLFISKSGAAAPIKLSGSFPGTLGYAYLNNGTTQFVQPSNTVTVAGTTAGNLFWSSPWQGSGYKKVVLNFQGYENSTATAQIVTFPTAFSFTPTATGCPSTEGFAVSTTTATLPSNGATIFTQQCIVEGQ